MVSCLRIVVLLAVRPPSHPLPRSPCRLFLGLDLDRVRLLVEKLAFVDRLDFPEIPLAPVRSVVLAMRFVLAAFARGSAIVVLVDHDDVCVVAVVVGSICSKEITIFGDGTLLSG